MVKINISTVRCENVLALQPVIPSCLSVVAASTLTCSLAHWVCTVLLSEVAKHESVTEELPKPNTLSHNVNEWKITFVSAPVLWIDSKDWCLLRRRCYPSTNFHEYWASIYSVIMLTKRKTNWTENINSLVEVIKKKCKWIFNSVFLWCLQKRFSPFWDFSTIIILNSPQFGKHWWDFQKNINIMASELF